MQQWFEEDIDLKEACPLADSLVGLPRNMSSSMLVSAEHQTGALEVTFKRRPDQAPPPVQIIRRVDPEFPFVEDTPLDRRRRMFREMWTQYGATRVPVIVGCRLPLKLKQRHYLAPSEMQFGQFQRLVRASLTHGEPSKELAVYYITRTGVAIPGCHTLMQIAEQHRDAEDGFLYLLVLRENAFG